MRVRIEFQHLGQVRRFDRQAQNMDDAKQLAAEIARDAGIDAETQVIRFERKCLIKLVAGDKQVETLETTALDEADAKRIAGEWAAKANLHFDTAVAVFQG